MNDDISDKDRKDWLRFINSKDKLKDKETNFKDKKNPTTRLIDLHGLNLDEANKTIENFINKAFSENINKLIVVTGKGLHSKHEKNPYVSKDLGILKYSIPEFILNNKDLMKMIKELSEASTEDGGSGAFYIYLKKNIKQM